MCPTSYLTTARLFLYFILSISFLPVSAQFEWAYDSLIHQGLALRDSNAYQMAIRKFQAAGRADPSRADEAETYILAVFESIEKQKAELADAQDATKAALSRVEKSLSALQIAEGKRLLAEGARLEAEAEKVLSQMKNERLAGYFFKEGSKEPSAWAYGPNGKFGVVNREGILQGEGFVWEEPDTFRNDMAIARRGGEYYFVGAEGEELSIGYKQLHPTDCSLWAGYRSKDYGGFAAYDSAQQKAVGGMRLRPASPGALRKKPSSLFLPYPGSQSYINLDGKELVHAQELNVTLGSTYYGLINFRNQNGKWGFLDSTGQIAIPPLYDDRVSDAGITTGAFEMKKNGLYGLVDFQGKEIFTFQNSRMVRFSAETFSFQREGKWGVVNNQGTEIFSPQYEMINLLEPQLKGGHFEAEYASVQKDGKWGVIHEQGTIILPAIYDKIESYSGGVFRVRDGKQTKFANTQGQELELADYILMEDFSDGFAWVWPSSDPDHWRIINRYGKEIGTPNLEFDSVDVKGFKEGRAAIEQGDRWGFVDTTGAIVISMQFEAVKDFSDGVAWVKESESWRLIDQEGSWVSTKSYDEVRPFAGSRAMVSQARKWGLINKSGNSVIPVEFDKISQLSFPTPPQTFYIAKQGEVATLFNSVGQIKVKGVSGFHEPWQITELNEGKLWAKKADKWVLMDTLGKEHLPLEYPSVQPFSHGLSKVSKKIEYGLFDTMGEEIVPAIFDEVREDVSGRAIVRRGAFYGIIDKEGNYILPVEYEKIEPFSEGMAMVKKGGLWGYLNAQNQLTLPPQYTEARNFSEGLAWVKDTNKWACIDTLGKPIFPFRYSFEGKEPKEGRVWVENKLHDLQGNLISSTQYRTTGQFQEGLSQVQDFNKRHGFVDRYGNEKVVPAYQKVEDFTYGLAKVQKRDRWGVVDSTGRIVVKPKYDIIDIRNSELIVGGRLNRDHKLNKKGWQLINRQGEKLSLPKWEAMGPFQNGVAALKDENEKWGLINEHGQLLQPFVYDEINTFADKRGRFKKAGLYGYFDETGDTIIPRQFEEAYRYADGFAIVRDPETNDWEFIDTMGQKALPPLYAFYLPYDSLLIKVFEPKGYGLYGLLNAAGEEVLPIKYDAIYWVGTGLASFKKDDRMGVVNHKGNILIPPSNYSGIGTFSQGLAAFTQDGKYGIIDTLGHVIVPPVYKYAVVPDYGLLWAMEIDEKYFNSSRIPPSAVTYHYFFTTGVEAETRKDVEAIRGFSNGMAAVSNGFGRFGFINEYRQLAVPVRYQDVEDFSEGLAAVKTSNGTLRYIDQEGNTAFEFPDYDFEVNGATKFTNGLAKVHKGTKVGLIDRTGKVLIKPNLFDEIELYEKIAVYRLDNSLYYSPLDENINLELATSRPTFSDVSLLAGFVRGKKNAKYGLYTIHGNPILYPAYDQIIQTGPHAFKLMQNDRMGLVKLKAGSDKLDSYDFLDYVDYLIPCEYEDIGNVPYGDLIPVKQNGKWGYIKILPQRGLWGNKKPQLVIPHRYDAATPFFESHGQRVARVYIESINQLFYINEKGEMLVETVGAEIEEKARN